LQRRYAFAFEVSFSRSSEDRLGSKTVLNPKSILHDPSQPFVLNFCHVSKITNEFPNRKLKNPSPWERRRLVGELGLSVVTQQAGETPPLPGPNKKRRGFLARAAVSNTSERFYTS
jgi:hypothetical protein